MHIGLALIHMFSCLFRFFLLFWWIVYSYSSGWKMKEKKTLHRFNSHENKKPHDSTIKINFESTRYWSELLASYNEGCMSWAQCTLHNTIKTYVNFANIIRILLLFVINMFPFEFSFRIFFYTFLCWQFGKRDALNSVFVIRNLYIRMTFFTPTNCIIIKFIAIVVVSFLIIHILFDIPFFFSFFCYNATTLTFHRPMTRCMFDQFKSGVFFFIWISKPNKFPMFVFPGVKNEEITKRMPLHGIQKSKNQFVYKFEIFMENVNNVWGKNRKNLTTRGKRCQKPNQSY